MEYVIGVDIGGTKIRVALIEATGQIIADVYALTHVSRGPHKIIEDIVQYIAQMRDHLPAGGTLIGIGVGCPGPLDPFKGIILSAPNMPGWNQVPLCAILHQRTHLPVRLANDANAAALAEWRFGGGVGYHHVVYITVSTGIGSGIIIDGNMLLGCQGVGAELGHMVIDIQGRKSWEELASGTALKMAAAEVMTTDPHTMLHELATPEAITAADVARAATQGDRVAQNLMQREALFLGLGFVNILHVFNPEIILVGGSVVTCNPTLLDEARTIVQERVIDDVYRSVPIQVAHLGDLVGVLGAGALWLTEPQEHR